MNYILLMAREMTTQIPEDIQNVTGTTSLSNFIGVGGIIATLLVGLVTCLVTWKLTMKNIKQLRLSYNMQIFPILSNTLTKNEDINLENLKIQYKEKDLAKPCLLAIEIVNIGNEAISNPPIKIKTDENIEIIPAYFEDVPPGYKELWRFGKTDSNECNILLEHINPNQAVKVRFFLDDLPQKKINFECPMEKVQTQEVAYSNDISTNRIELFSKFNAVLISITVLLFVTVQQWGMFIEYFIRITGAHLCTRSVVIFVMMTLLLAIFMNIYGIPWGDQYVKTHLKQAKFIKFVAGIVSIILLALTIFDYIIVKPIPQIIAGIIVIILLSLFIHISFILRKK